MQEQKLDLNSRKNIGKASEVWSQFAYGSFSNDTEKLEDMN